MIHREVCEKSKFDHIHRPESVLENEMHIILWDFEMQTDHLIPVRRPDLVIVNKQENLPNSGLCRPGRPLSENISKQKAK